MLSQSVEKVGMFMQAKPVLMVTQDNALWQVWQSMEQLGWQPQRGSSLSDVEHLRSSENALVILDVTLLNQHAEKNLTNTLQGLRVLALSSNVQDEEGQRMLSQGACGYGHAYSSAEQLSQMLKSIETGSIWMGRSLLKKLLQDIDQRLPAPTPVNNWMQGLSPREVEAARLAAVGQSNADIAQVLGITERTVRAHLSMVFEKMNVHDRLQLALKVHGIKGL